MDGVYFLSILTLISNITFVFFGLTFLWAKLTGKNKLIRKVLQKLSKNVLMFSLIFALVATLGSLYLSEVRKFTPCILCWYQRILMYPQAVILAVALYKKTSDVFKYTLVLSSLGALLAGYHYMLQVNPSPLAPCSAVGFSVSCTEKFFTYFGYITIPWMSLSAFVFILVLSVIGLKAKSSR